MRRTVATLLLSCLFTALGLVVAAPASACSCTGGTTQDFFDRADAVFTARLVSREGPRGVLTSSADAALYVFAVDAVYKGSAQASQEVLSPDSGASCGLELTGEGSFVVFATRSADLGGTPFATPAAHQYAALLCGGSGPATPEVEAELQALATPEPPSGSPPGPADPVDIPSGRYDPLLLAASVVALGAVGLLLRRTLRRRACDGARRRGVTAALSHPSRRSVGRSAG